MASPTLVKIPLPDGKAYIIVRVASGNASRQPFELTLMATEGTRAFEAKLTETTLSAGKSERFKGTVADLRAIVEYLLLETPVPDAKLAEGLDLTAATDETGITLRIRRSFGRVKQPIATLTIPEQEIDIPIFDWAAESCAALDAAKEQLRTQQTATQDRDKRIESLQLQLQAVTALKKEHEDLLLVKFKELLNAKKAKIRELGQALEAATAARETEVLGDLQQHEGKGKGKAVAPPSPSPVPVPAPTRGHRRAAPKAAVKKATTLARNTRKRKPIPPPSDSEDGFAASKMEVDEPPRRATRGARIARGGGSKALEKKVVPVPDDDNTASESEGRAQHSDRKESEDEDELPPIRMPIQWGLPKAAPPPPPPVVEKASTMAPAAIADNGDETEDDEL